MLLRRPVSLIAIAISFLAILFLFSCRNNGKTHPAWNTNLLLPLITTNLSINDIVADSLIHKNADSSINLVYKTNLYNLNLASQVVNIPDTTLTFDFKLDSLHLANRSIVDSISLGRVAQKLGGDTGALIIALNGTKEPIPALSGISTNNYSVNATSFFQTASIETGTLTVSLFNGFPVTLSEIIFQLSDSITKSIVVTDTFSNVAPNTSQSKNINLAGKTIDGHLLARVVNLSTLASNGSVLIDTSNSIVASLSVSNLTVYSATAIFPAQDIIDEPQSVSLPPPNGAEVKQVKMLSGTLQIILKSTINDSIHFNYILPSATDANGNAINISSILPPAQSGKTSSFTENFNLAGYTFDMRGPKKDTVNTFFNQLIARIDSTGKIETISLNDSLYVSYAILNVVPEYLNGYVGRDTLNYGPVTIPFSVFKNIKGGTLALKNINLSLDVQNGIGANGRVVVKQVSGIHSSNNSQVALTGTMINKNLNIPRATDKPLTTTLTNFTLTPSNSDVLKFVDNLPNELNYALSVYINPNGNVSNFNDFVYYSSGLNISMNMNLPLSLIANQLELVDTIPFSLAGNSKSANTDAIQSGVLTLIANNGFPMQANVQLYFLDGNYNVLDSLLTSYASIASGQLNNNCQVVSPTESKIPAPFTEAKLNKIKLAKYVMVKAFFTTMPNSQCSKYITIYSDYGLGISITGQFNYYTGN